MTLAGDWFNELGSRMQVGVDQSGLISGEYWTPIGTAGGAYRAVGLTTPAAARAADIVIGWTVYWGNPTSGDLHSQTTWLGQFHSGVDEFIVAHWLLNQETLPPSVGWRDTLIGTDTFRRQPPSVNGRFNADWRPRSHPKRAG